MALKLFAVLLGGNPPGSGTEVHDVVFAVGERIEDTYDQLRAAWFAPGKAPHIDSWMELEVVDRARIVLATEPMEPGQPDLWHVHLGFYEAGTHVFQEGHENRFVVAADAAAAKVRAKQLANRTSIQSLHTDAINRVSDRLAAAGSDFRVRLISTEEVETPVAHDGYRPFAG
ncbi:MAG: DUF1543 domain-containing protein [Firmicutes bacterium]|nr:DUF1543 domain-containing protein [Bacillota bacterium]